MIFIILILLLLEIFWFMTSVGLFHYILILHRRIETLGNDYNRTNIIK